MIRKAKKYAQALFYRHSLLFGFGLAVFALAVAAPAAHAQVYDVVAGAMAGIAQIIIELVGKLLIVLIELLIAIVKYNDFINAPAVVKGWILVRDFSNLTFLIIFIAIAFATILGVEKYEYKRLLPKLLLMAVAINFSRTISGIVIDAAQVVMITFVNGFKDVAAGNLITGFGLSNMLSIRAQEGNDAINPTSLAAASILAVVLLVIAVITLGVIVLMFLVRIMYLWLLVVLSPLAFMLGAAPGAERWFQDWWKKLFQYAFVGPILAFFLWLSFSIMSQVQPGSNLAVDSKVLPATGFGEAANNTSAAISGIGRSDQLLSYAISISLLLMSLSIANSMGVKGGSLASAALGKIKSGGIKLGKLAGLGITGGGIVGGVGAYGLGKLGQKAGKFALKAPKGAWELAKYADQKAHRHWNKSLNFSRGWESLKEKFSETKRKDVITGAEGAAQKMKSGKFMDLVYGFTGGGRDFGEAFARGPFGYTGIKRGLKILTKGKTGADQVFAEVEEEKKKDKEAAREAEIRRAVVDKHDYTQEGKKAFVKREMEEGGEEKIKERAQLTDKDLAIKDADGKSVSFSTKWQAILKAQGITLEKTQIGMTPDELRGVDGLDPRVADLKEKEKEAFAKQSLQQEYTDKADSVIAQDGKHEDQEALLNAINELGRKSIDDEISARLNEIKRVEDGGLADGEIKSRNQDLEAINNRIAKTLEEIKRQEALGYKTDSLQKKLNAQKREGFALGGQYNTVEKKFNGDTLEKANKEDLARRAVSNAQTEEEKEQAQKNLEIFLKEKEALDEEKKKTGRDPRTLEAEQELERLQFLQKAVSMSPDDREKIKKEIAQYEKESQQHKIRAVNKTQEAQELTPGTFYASRARRLLEEEEKRMITTDLDSELIADFRTAEHEGDNIKATAIMKKMTQDGNDNELWNSYGFASTIQGMHDFVNAVLVGKKGVKKADGTVYSGPGFGMDEQTAYAIENDISYINEGINHWETARAMKVENGVYKQLSDQEHVVGALSEIMKMNTREIARAFNRLAFGGEVPKPDGTRTFEITNLGKGILMALGPEIQYHFDRNEYNKNAVMNLGPLLDQLRDIGVDEQYIVSARAKYLQFSEEAGKDIQEIVRRIFDNHLAQRRAGGY